MILFHSEDVSWEFRRDLMIETINNKIESDKPNYIKIIDPFFLLGMLIDYNNHDASQRFWRYLFEEISCIDSIDEINIITTKSLVNYVKSNLNLTKGLSYDGNEDKAIYDFEGLNNIKIIVHYYPNPDHNNINPQSIYPILHDRWFIWESNDSVKALHLGGFFNNIIQRDITITELNGDYPQKAAYRFDEIIKYAKWRCDEKSK